MAGFTRLLKQQFWKKNFFVSHANPLLFISSEESRKPTVLYDCYLTMLMTYEIVLSLYSGLGNSNKHGWKLFIYYTYWTLYLFTIGLILRTSNAWFFYCAYRKNKEAPSSVGFTLKLQWILYNVTTGASLSVFFLYWIFIHKDGKSITFMGINTHAINAVIALVDLFITGIPIRLLHFYQGMIVSTIYGVFVIIYWGLGGLNSSDKPYIYSILDYSTKPGLALGASLGFVLLNGAFIQTLMFGLYFLRITVYKKLKGQTSSMKNDEEKGTEQALT